MYSRITTGSCVALLVMLFDVSANAHDPASGACGESSANLAHELAVMRSAAIPINADANTASPPRLALDKRYAVNLVEQKQLRFRTKPGRAARSASPRGGAFQFEVPVAGRYRVSITSRHWIDVVQGETAVDSVGHHGPGCELVHKIVEFDLLPGAPYTLQLSGQDDAIIGLAITASPAPKPKGAP